MANPTLKCRRFRKWIAERFFDDDEHAGHLCCPTEPRYHVHLVDPDDCGRCREVARATA